MSNRGKDAVVKTTGTRGFNVNILACMSAVGIILRRNVEKVSWLTFNDFLEEISREIMATAPGQDAVIIFDNAPAHRRVTDAALLKNGLYGGPSLKNGPPYSPFFNPIQKTFSKFKSGVKAYL
ncbi:hypothetical protein HPB47_012658, partial [Ixodes persulcatus]